MANARGPGRDHRHPDAREHDREPAPHPGRGLRRGQRHPRRHRRGDALRRERGREVPGGRRSRRWRGSRTTPRSTAWARSARAGPTRAGRRARGPGGPGTPITRSLTRVAALGGRGARLQADPGLHRVGHHRPPGRRPPPPGAGGGGHPRRPRLPPARAVVGRGAGEVGVRREHRRPAGRGRGAAQGARASPRRGTPSSCSPATRWPPRPPTCCGSTRSRDAIPRRTVRVGRRGISKPRRSAEWRPDRPGFRRTRLGLGAVAGRPAARGLLGQPEPEGLRASRRRRRRRWARSSRASPPGTAPGTTARRRRAARSSTRTRSPRPTPTGPSAPG